MAEGPTSSHIQTAQANLRLRGRRTRTPQEVRREKAASPRALAVRLLQQSVGIAVDLVDLVVDGLALAEPRSFTLLRRLPERRDERLRERFFGVGAC
jgi:hypothetical protein